MSTHPLSRRSFLARAALASLGLQAAGQTRAQTRKTRVGCQANAFVVRNGSFDALLPVLTQIAALGYAGFECNNHLVQAAFADAPASRRKIAATGLEFIGMHTSMKEAETGLDTMAAGGAALGCRYIVISSEGLSPTGDFTPDALHQKTETLNAYGRTVKSHGMTLAYHNHMPEFANHNAEIQALADHTDPAFVSFLIDAGHAYQGGGDPAAFLRRNPSRLVGCHLKTFRNKIDQVPLGQGDFNFDTLAEAIRSIGWSGWIIDEEGGGKTADSAAVGPDREYIRKVFGA